MGRVGSLASWCGLAWAVGLAGCASSDGPPDPGLAGLALERVEPGTAVPGTRVRVTGDSFVEAEWGDSRLVLTGDLAGQPFEARWPLAFVDYDQMEVVLTTALWNALPGEGEFVGEAVVEVVSAVDGETYRATAIDTRITFVNELAPTVDALQATGVIFVNDRIEIEGAGFLLGGEEGETWVEVSGCFDEGFGCAPIATHEEVAQPVDPWRRDRVSFRFAPQIAGIQPGTFVGEVVVANRPRLSQPRAATPAAVDYEILSAQVFEFNPAAASLGQYVFVSGGGFVGGEADPGGSTTLQLEGTFTLDGGGASAVNLTLIPEVVDGRIARYVLNEDDALGAAIDLRSQTGTFAGTVTPEVTFDGASVTGASEPFSLRIAPVKQVVFIDFRPTYVEALRAFGLRALDQAVRTRVLEVVRSLYPAVNIEFRTEAPTDFAQYSWVELHGPDPNGKGLFGYDNTPGKDVGNERLYDRLGGVNAETQFNGYDGFGGVFLTSLMGFSEHPEGFAESIPGASARFDQIFDEVRPDRGGDLATSADAIAFTSIGDGALCPAADRPGRVACAVFVLGNLVGGTLAHEIGHSLGLANPQGDGFHNQGDEPGRLMDSGGDRSFEERALLDGQGPGVFCDEEYAYLRMILPSDQPADSSPRPPCF